MATRTGVDEVLQAAVTNGDVPCVVAMAGDRDGVIYEGAAGERTPGSGEMVGPDTMFRIASMTKMVATVAALQLVERGQLDLDDTVETYLPEFGELQVLEGFDGDTPRLRAPATRATVRQLVTHTTGLTYWFWNADMVRWHEVTGTPNVLSGSMEIFKAPLVADPGTRFEYGINVDWLGRVVEAAGGRSLRDHMQEHILDPLGMGSTTFVMDEEQRAACVPIHVRGEDGAWAATDLDWSQEPEWWAGGHGLYSTPADYLRFQRMLLCGGTLDGRKILEPATVEAAFRNEIGALEFPAHIATADPDSSFDFDAGPGLKWGLGLLLNPTAADGMRAAGSGAWAGLFNTHFWVDTASGVTGAVYCQTLPFAEPRVYAVYQGFESALYASLGEQPMQRRFTREGAPVEEKV
jgi:CubicO group peptidase (beta-lactamase class C family)